MPRQACLNDLVHDQRLIDAAWTIIENGSCAVSKPVRAGFTTSAVMACEQKGRKLLILAPTRRILMETVKDASSETVRIPGNSECPRFAKMLKETPILVQLPMTLPDCDKCKLSSWCEIREILGIDDPRIMALTYAKLEALMLSNGATAAEIKDKISRAEVNIFDEAHVISLPSVVTVKAFTSLHIPAEYSALVQAYVRWLELCLEYASTIQELMQQAETNHASKHLSRHVINPDPADWTGLKIAWSQLRELAVKHLLPDDQILQLRDIITLIGASAISITFIGSESVGEEDETGSVYLSTGQNRLWQAVREFLIYREPGSCVIFGSATLFEPYKGFFADLTGKDIKQTVFPDIRNATRKMELIPDTWTLGARNFKHKLPKIVATVKAIADREKQSIYLLAPSSEKAAVLEREFAKADIKRIHVDYYRSDGTLGVERKDRICITIGLAQIPSNAYDSLAQGMTLEEMFLDSRRLRELSVHAATWQAVNRVRDPEGKVESTVFFIGCRLDQVKQVATWGTNRRLELVKVEENRNGDTNIPPKPTFDVQVDEAIETPRIQGEIKTSDNTRYRSVKDYIDKIETNFIISEKPDNMPIHIYGHKVRIFGIYNFPHNTNELESTSQALLDMFCHRRECHVQQVPNWIKFNKPITVDLIKKHVKKEITIGSYQISLDDTVKWVCFDFDVHPKEEHTNADIESILLESTARRERLQAVLKGYWIPYLLEASGSLHSYHIWIFLAETKTYNAYRFCKQLKVESDIPLTHESFPKQEHLDKNSKYGNQVKVPICINRKNGGHSAFLDPETMKPLEGEISHPGLVYLHDIPDLDEVKANQKGIPSAKFLQRASAPLNTVVSGTALDYCMQGILDARTPLEGAAGHLLRLAIAIKAKSIGLDAETTVNLFKEQKDFDHDFSLDKVLETWGYSYKNWSCKKLLDQCGELVRPYCVTCPYCPRGGVAGMAVS